MSEYNMKLYIVADRSEYVTEIYGIFSKIELARKIMNNFTWCYRLGIYEAVLDDPNFKGVLIEQGDIA